MMLSVLAVGRGQSAFDDLHKHWSRRGKQRPPWEETPNSCQRGAAQWDVIKQHSKLATQGLSSSLYKMLNLSPLILNSCYKTASQGIPSERGVQNAAQKEKETPQEPVIISGNLSASSDPGILWGVSQPLLKRRRWRQGSDLPQSDWDWDGTRGRTWV